MVSKVICRIKGLIFEIRILEISILGEIWKKVEEKSDVWIFSDDPGSGSWGAEQVDQDYVGLWHLTHFKSSL